MKPEVPRVHAVTDAQIAARPNLDRLAAALAVSPSVALHARLPDADGRMVFDLALRLRRASAIVLVNDRVDVARITDAAGAHLPANGLPIASARALLSPDQLLGRSTHHPDEARRAADEGADYVFLGPIWESATHPGRAGIGLEALRGLGSIKVIAIGGITAARAAQCRDAGAWGVAAIAALWNAADPAAAVRAMLLSFA